MAATTISILPTEILAEIFQHFIPSYPQCPPLFGLDSPSLLLTVCRRWSSVALETPKLWRGLSVPASYTNRILERYSARLVHTVEVWLGRSRACLLSIQFTNNALKYPLEKLIEVVLAHHDRWEHVSLQATEYTWRSFRSPAMGFSHLKSLWLCSQDSPSDLTLPLNIGPTPSLRAVSLEGFGCAPATFKFAWERLSTVRITDIAVVDCMPILRYATSLEHCRLLLLDGGIPGGNHEPIVLPALRSLMLDISEFDDEALDQPTLVGVLSAPQLASLHILATLLGPAPIDVLQGLITRSRCTLKRLHIHGFDLGEEEAGYFWRDTFVEEDSLHRAFPEIEIIISNRLYSDWPDNDTPDWFEDDGITSLS